MMIATKGTLDKVVKEGIINRIYECDNKTFLFVNINNSVTSIDISYMENIYKKGQKIKIIMNGFRHVKSIEIM